MSETRAIAPLSNESLRGIVPAAAIGAMPTFEFVDPRALLVEETYQRDIVQNGIGLIRKIVAGFSWACFKPPICVRLDDGSLVCIDGQHTATAAASHPEVDKIPVMIVDAATTEFRAQAFVGHNKNRINLTAQAVFHAQVAAGNGTAKMIAMACEATGARVPRKAVSFKDKMPVGTTLALGTMRAVVENHGREGLERVLRIMVKAGRGPIRADEMTAAALLCFATGFRRDDDLAGVVASRSADAWRATAMTLSADTKHTNAIGLAVAWAGVLGVPAPIVTKKEHGFATARLIPKKPPPPKPEPPKKIKPPAAAPTPPPPPAPKPPPAPPVPPAAAPAKAAPAAPQAFVRNGVSVDPFAKVVEHRGVAVKIASDAGLRLVMALAAVMPALLDFDRLARRVFHRASSNPSFELQLVIDEIAPALRQARLEIKTVPKMGNTLFDLGG